MRPVLGSRRAAQACASKRASGRALVVWIRQTEEGNAGDPRLDGCGAPYTVCNCPTNSRWQVREVIS